MTTTKTGLPVKVEPNLPVELLGLDRPSLVGLSYALRHPETWPEGFTWQFDECIHCAMGLARRLWNIEGAFGNKSAPSKVARLLAMPYEDALRIFMTTEEYRRGPFGLFGRRAWETITPEMVADAIDRHLATRK